MAPRQRPETHQTSLHTLTQLPPISVAAQDTFPQLTAPSRRATSISCPVVAAEMARCPLPRDAEVRSPTRGHVWDLETQEARWSTTETAGRREGNGFQGLKHSVRSKDPYIQGLGAALLLTQPRHGDREAVQGGLGFSAHPSAVRGAGKESEHNVLQRDPYCSTPPYRNGWNRGLLFFRQGKSNQDYAGHSSRTSAPTPSIHLNSSRAQVSFPSKAPTFALERDYCG